RVAPGDPAAMRMPPTLELQFRFALLEGILVGMDRALEQKRPAVPKGLLDMVERITELLIAADIRSGVLEATALALMGLEGLKRHGQGVDIAKMLLSVVWEQEL